jgi:hypothetical protein
MGYYNMEKEPKGAKSSDMTGQKKEKTTSFEKMTGPNSMKGTKGMSGEKFPKGANMADESGERKMPLVGGVGQGRMDSIGARDNSHMGKIDGRTGEFNTGSRESECYVHERTPHIQDSM